MSEASNLYIDHTSLLAGVVATLSYRSPDQSPALAHLPAIEVTGLLLSGHRSSICLAAAPSTLAGVHGLSSHLVSSLDAIVSYRKPDDAVKRQATNRVVRWGRQSYRRVREIRDSTVNANGFDEWFDWTIRNTWAEHASTYGELFNRAFFPVIARVLDCSNDDLDRIWTLGQQLTHVTAWSKRPSSEDAQLATQAYLVAALLRGRYHNYVAQAEVRTILHHPWRAQVLPNRRDTALVMPSNTLQYVAGAIVKASYVEKTVRDRVSLWAENVLMMRRALAAEVVDLSHKGRDDVARDAARLALKRAGLRNFPRRVVAELDLLKSVSVTGFFFGLSTWLSMPLGQLLSPTTPFLLRRLFPRSSGVAERTARKLFTRRRRQLIEMWPAGRILGRWS